jgi:hypothetical protein
MDRASKTGIRFEKCVHNFNKVDFKEKGRDSVDWVNLAKGRDQRWALTYTIMNILIP